MRPTAGFGEFKRALDRQGSFCVPAFGPSSRRNWRKTIWLSCDGNAGKASACSQGTCRMDCPVILGNHDEACAQPGLKTTMNEYARAGVTLARARLSGPQKKWLRNLPILLDVDGFTAVHASLSGDERWPYVLGRKDAARHFVFQEKPLCFCGHTHRPAVWHEQRGKIRNLPADNTLDLSPDARFLVNVGSVGQPRNLRPEACYVVYDMDKAKIEFRFVTYNVKTTQCRRKNKTGKLCRDKSGRVKQGGNERRGWEARLGD